MIGTAAAIIGSAVLGAGATALASSNSAKAAKTAGNDQLAATQASIAEQQREFDAIQANNAPFRNAGLSALSAVGGSFGLPGFGSPSMTGGSVGSTPVANPGGVSMTGGFRDQAINLGDSFTPVSKTGAAYSPISAGPSMTGGDPSGQSGVNWMQYLQDNPDAMANFQVLQASGRTDPVATDPIAFAQNHYITDGSRRPLPMFGATPAVAPPAPQAPPSPTGYVAPPGYTDPVAPNGYNPGPRPDIGARPDAGTAPTRMDVGAAPTRMTMAPLDVSLGSYQQSPDYNFRLQQGQNALDHVASSMGGIMSGARVKAANRYNEDYATTDYNNWRDYTTGQYNTDRNVSNANYGVDLGQYDINRGVANSNYGVDLGQYDANRSRTDANYSSDRARSDGLFADDRSFLTNAYNTRTGQLLDLAGFGQGATNATNSAGQSFAQNQSALTMAGGNAQANAAINSANAFSSGVNNLVTTGAYLGGKFMTGGYGVNPSLAAGGMAGYGGYGSAYGAAGSPALDGGW